MMKRAILISGVSAGFGQAIAELLVRRGFLVLGVARRQDRLDDLTQKLGASNFCAVRADVRDRPSLNAALAAVPDAFSNIVGLVNNAGLALGLEDAQNAAIEDWETMVDTNIKGVLNLTHYFLKRFIALESADIINIGSIAGTYPYRGGNVYGATKAFVQQFSLNLKADLLGTGVRVCDIEPGMAETEFSEVRFRGDASKAKSVYSGMTPLSAGDIAETVLWILERPKHVNINRIELMPVAQAFGPFVVSRN